MIYVNMTDPFMSGWGQAPGRSYYCILCDNMTQAAAIERAAMQADMKRVAIAAKPRKGGQGDNVKITHVSELGGHWLRYMPFGHMTDKQYHNFKKSIDCVYS